MKRLLLYSAVLLLVTTCGSNRQFTAQDNHAYQDLQDLVASRSFEIISNSATPFASAAFSRVANSNILGPGNNAGNIDITTNANKLAIKGDSIQGYLPFFGDQNFGGGYGGTHTGIEFNEVPKDYKVVHNDKKHTVEIRFKIDDVHRSNEHYDMIVTLYPNNRSTIRVQSTTRSSIEYTGKVSSWEEPDK